MISKPHFYHEGMALCSGVQEMPMSCIVTLLLFLRLLLSLQNTSVSCKLGILELDCFLLPSFPEVCPGFLHHPPWPCPLQSASLCSEACEGLLSSHPHGLLALLRWSLSI